MSSPRMVPLVTIAAGIALAFGGIVTVPAAAATVTVATWGDLASALTVDGDIVILGGDITAPTNSYLVLDAGESVVLDLAGYTLTIATPGDQNAAVLVPATSSLTIEATGGGSLVATGGNSAAGIGSGISGDAGAVTINGGTVIATGGINAAGIGGGGDGVGGTVTINGGTVTASGAIRGAGIGGGVTRNGGTTTINGGIVTATGGDYAAGIGGGGYGGDGVSTVIAGGTVTAIGGTSAAGIGRGYLGEVTGTLEIHGTPDSDASTDGGQPLSGSGFGAALITNPSSPVGVGYSAVADLEGDNGEIGIRFNYLVNFDAAGGTAVAGQTVNESDRATVPAAPTRDGYLFAGWQLGSDLYDFTALVTGPITLSAQWTLAPMDVPTDSPNISAVTVLAATGSADMALPVGGAGILLLAGVSLLALQRRSRQA
jgi:uncharacterized repeat protein (TIGR02543 family)